MSNADARESVAAAMRRINQVWLDRRPEDLAPLFHPDLIMVVPGFEAAAEGRDAIVAGFADFCTNAVVHEYREDPLRVDVVGDTAVATFRYEMVYERSGEEYRATGRDLWVFARRDGAWLAVWRTMLDPSEKPA
jgi:uncharacterized protein (TIGR02246 family)